MRACADDADALAPRGRARDADDADDAEPRRRKRARADDACGCSCEPSLGDDPCGLPSRVRLNHRAMRGPSADACAGARLRRLRAHDDACARSSYADACDGGALRP